MRITGLARLKESLRFGLRIEVAAIALARIELDDDPATWPTSELGGEGVAAAALITDRLDLLPQRLADPAELWRALPRVFRMLVWQRNPALAVYAIHAAPGGSRLG